IPLFEILGYGLLGGLILNLMPCVLPVIGLKVMSFAKQGGESRSHILMLNLAYAAGLLAVFMVLAGHASLVQLGLSEESYGWGELYTLTWFKVTMTCFVFAMALSFLGVWELPIPGFATTGKATELTSQEGMSGAFFMGVFTTILATPCSGPFLGPVFGYTIAQPTSIIFAIFASVGLGMALPYLLIGLFPSLVSWIPKPGAWMDTFKNLMGFVLLGTVVYLFSTMNLKFFLPTLSLCIGIWFACWWIGRTPATASEKQKNFAYFGGLGTAALVGILAFKLLTPSANQLPWQPYSPEALAAARAEGKTVLVDFTANWCPTCKTNLKFAINREEVLEKVEQNDVVTLLADWTDKNATIKAALEELDSISIPLMAIYPAGEQEPIVLPDLLTKQMVLDALDQAGPSLDAEGTQQMSRRYPVTR
ncbi:MAG: thioredoxin family protein, partial [Lacipirellulaceae bacterium]